MCKPRAQGPRLLPLAPLSLVLLAWLVSLRWTGLLAAFPLVTASRAHVESLLGVVRLLSGPLCQMLPGRHSVLLNGVESWEGVDCHTGCAHCAVAAMAPSPGTSSPAPP